MRRLVPFAALLVFLAGCTEGERLPPSQGTRGRPPERLAEGLFYCPPGFEVAVYDGVFYPPLHPDPPRVGARPDRCFRSEADARRSGNRRAGPDMPTLRAHRRSRILYGIGVSTDPFGVSSRRGFGLLVATPEGRQKIERRRKGWGTEAWLGPGRFVVSRPISVTNPVTGEAVRVRRLVLYRKTPTGLEPAGPAPLPAPVWTFSFSPGGTLVAYQPVRWTEAGWRPASRIVVASQDRSSRRTVARGELAGWAPDGRMLYWPDPAHRQLMALDLHSGRAVSLFSGEDVAALAGVAKASVGPAIWSADRRYIAFRADVPWPRASKRFGTIAIARPDGRIFRLITSPYVVSMLAWSPREHRLAYTTSGFPDPHELIIVDGPGAAPRRVFGGTAHFDWATWSPDGRWVLIDDEDHKRWLILDAAGRKDARWLPRLGGRPQWCCPEGEWSASSGI